MKRSLVRYSLFCSIFPYKNDFVIEAEKKPWNPLPILHMQANWFISNLHFVIKIEVQHVTSNMLPNTFMRTIFV